MKSDEAFGSAAELGSETDRRSVNAVQKSSDHSGVDKGDRKEKHVSSQTESENTFESNDGTAVECFQIFLGPGRRSQEEKDENSKNANGGKHQTDNESGMLEI